VVIDARYKSLFVVPATGVTVVLFGASLYAALLGGNEATAWLGAAIASLPLLLLMTSLVLRSVSRTSENLPLLIFMALAGVLVAVWEQFFEGTSGWQPTSVAVAAALILLVYIFWYSRFGRIESMALSVGARLPQFTLADTDRNEFDSKSLLGSPAVLMFYRGNWCPLCMAQIREIADRYQELEAMGIKVVLISPQPEEYSRKLAAQYNLPFEYLIDSDNRLAIELGIAVQNGVPIGMPGGYSPDTVLPTLVVCNEKGTIVFSDQTDNYRVRPEPDVFLAILRRSGVIAK